MKRFILIALILCCFPCMAHIAFGLDAGITSDPDTTWNIIVDHSTNCVLFEDDFITCRGIVLDSVRVDSGDAAARHIDTCILAVVELAPFDNVSAWCYASTLNDSAYVNATLLDTCRVVFQSSHDGNVWYDMQNANVEDTVLTATNVTATQHLLARSSSATAAPFGRYLRIMVRYNLAVGVQEGSGCQDWWPCMFHFGYTRWHTYR